jgi:hypothetical protein
MLLAILACAPDTAVVSEPPASSLPSSPEAPPSEPPVISSPPPEETEEPEAPLEPWFGTEAWGQALAIRSNLPAALADCEGLVDPPCEDLDADGLVDLWEDEVLARTSPALQLDEAEPLVDDPEAVVALVGRVAPVGAQIHVYIMIGYHYDYGRCGLSSHDGDSERVVVAYERMTGPEDELGDVQLVGAYTAAHEDTLTDHGHVYQGDELGELSFPLDPVSGEPRWMVWPSDGKHATYGSIDACESASFIPCVEEDCAPDGVDPALFSLVPPVYNAGEPLAPRLTDLSSIGFPEEDAWLEQDFCGGRGRGFLCSAPVRDKLLEDPF